MKPTDFMGHSVWPGSVPGMLQDHRSEGSFALEHLFVIYLR